MKILGRAISILLGLAAPAMAGSSSTIGGGGAPSGAAGGALSGTYPNPTLATSGSPCSAGQFVSALSTSGVVTCTMGFGPGGGTVSGRYYPFFGDVIVTGLAFSSTALIKCSPGFVARPVTAVSLVGMVSTTTAGNMQLSLYASKSDGSGPSTLLSNTGSIAIGTTANTPLIGALGSAIALTPNTEYWRCSQLDNTAIIPISTGTTFLSSISGYAAAAQFPRSASAGYQGLSFSPSGQTFGTWPSDLSTATPTEIVTGGAPVMTLVAQ